MNYDGKFQNVRTTRSKVTLVSYSLHLSRNRRVFCIDVDNAYSRFEMLEIDFPNYFGNVIRLFDYVIVPLFIGVTRHMNSQQPGRKVICGRTFEITILV